MEIALIYLRTYGKQQFKYIAAGVFCDLPDATSIAAKLFDYVL